MPLSNSGKYTNLNLITNIIENKGLSFSSAFVEFWDTQIESLKLVNQFKINRLKFLNNLTY